MNRWIKGAAPVLSTLLLAAFLWTGCDILDVENPNNLIEDDLNNPAAAGPMANGAEAAVARALSFVYAPYSVATDEMTWVGSRDAWGQLDNGVIDFPGNEFSDQAYPYVGEARWMTDEFAKRLEAFREQGAGNSPAQMRVYLYKAIIYTTIADMFDDFTISDRTEPGPPVGPQNMGTLYDEALSAVNKALALGPTGELEAALLGMKARIVHGKAVWQKVNPVDTANPLVSAGAAEAAAALAKMDPDFRYQMVFDGGFQLANYMASEVNNRLEFTFTDTWVRRNAAGNKVEEVTYPDMIDGVVHPYLQEVIETYVAEREYSDITVVSAREMHLILAEAALAGGDMNGFTTHINNLRALDGLSPYSGQVDARQLLIESRAVNLFLQGRRLADLYRFGLRSPEWVDTAPAVTRPGTFLPITRIEIEANPLVQ
ncbi:hypothetical protein GQ464_015850 [Rhodocaloribacter litoris]|uniref:RagB/SusD family nutrient uptake outer membrane protein n=1 Tax=Rhodocaloribacter litoris TaxID=2558931 RepID=UPI00141DB0D6|nr:RagB/SusD family nutrient uptake outer membrane protein [Rhodocaloribacter litoris]QXD14872.1 hypothetical protein GQ464_015850 [Rhodocaloribacter litoris]